MAQEDARLNSPDAYSNVPSLALAHTATHITHELGESPVWDPIRHEVLWVDAPRGSVFVGKLQAAGGIEILRGYRVPGAAAAVAIAADGRILVVGDDRVHTLSAGGEVESSPPLIQGPERQFNDAKPDPSGRILVGTMGALDGDALFIMREDGTLDPIDVDLTISNGLAWTKGGDAFFSVDSLTRRIFVRSYDARSGETGASLDLSSGVCGGVLGVVAGLGC